MRTEKRIQQLPAPPEMDRVETGAVQFGDDWPGLFLRCDNAHSLMCAIRQLLTLLADHSSGEIVETLVQLNGLAEMIDQNVVVR